MKTAFITGGAGFLGSYITENLANKGYKVICLVKEHHDTKLIEKANVKIIRGDLLKPETFKKYIPNNCTIFHCYSLSPGANTTKEKYFNENVEGTKNLLRACKKIKKFVYISSLSVVGPRASNNKMMNEKTEPTPDNNYGLSKLEAEKIIRKFHETNKVLTIITRLSTLYGPRCHKNSASGKLFKMIKKPIFIVIGNGNNIYEFNFIKNIAKGVILAAENVKDFGIYNVGDIKKITYNEVINEIKKNVNKKAIIIHIPKYFAYILGYIGELASKITHKKTIFTIRTVNGLLGGWATSYEKAVKEIGLKQDYSLKEGIKETAEWLKEEGRI